MAALDGWNLDQYRALLRRRAQTLRIDPRVQVRFDESDLVQETLARALEPNRPPCLGSTDGERIAWLFAVQERLLLDKYDEQFAQKRDPRREVDKNALQRAFVDSTADFLPAAQDAGPSPSEDAAKREELQILADFLDQLTQEHREVLLMRQEGRTLDEIAQKLGVSVGSIAGRIARATKQLAHMSRKLRKEEGGSG
jgi:RNA polymerase sigma-70 factor, ECF subfamily